MGVYFNQKINAVDITNMRPLWRMILAFSKEGTLQRFLQRVFTFRGEQFYTNDSKLWRYDDVREAILNLKDKKKREVAIAFFKYNFVNFANDLQNVKNIDTSITDDKIDIVIYFFNENNKEDKIEYSFCVDKLL